MRIVNTMNGSDYCEGARLPNVIPSDTALTNDGRYAVVSLSGRTRITLDTFPSGVALHPTKPIAYVQSLYGGNITVLRLAILGVE